VGESMGVWLIPLQVPSGCRKQYGLDRLSAASRYFLCRFIKDYEESKESKESMRQMAAYARDFYQSERSVRRAVDELVRSGILLEKRSANGPGRPSLRLSVSCGFWDVLVAQLADHAFLHKEKIEHVFMGEFPSNRGTRKTRLTPENRTLLAVLLLNADKSGAAQIGMGKLGRMTGLSDDQLKSQFTKLAAEGYLRGRVSGFSGKCLFGRVAGYVFLNLRHMDLGGFGDQITIIQCSPGLGQATELYREAKAVHFDLKRYRDSSSGLGGYPPCHYPGIQNAIRFETQWTDDCFWHETDFSYQGDCEASEVLPKLQLDRHFQEKQLSLAASYLQMRINHYASMLLTNGERESTISLTHLKELEDSVRGELKPTEKSDVEVALRAFLTAVWQQVKYATGMIAQVKRQDQCLIDELERKEPEYLILPTEAVLRRQHALTLQISTKEGIGSGGGGCWVINMPGHDSKPDEGNDPWGGSKLSLQGGSGRKAIKYLSERSLSEEERISYGLRLRGHKYPTEKA